MGDSLSMEKQKLLFTPGPLTTSETVKQAMLRDLGSRDTEFLEVVRKIRRRLLELGEVADGSYEAVLMQGSGTFGVESVISSVVPREGKLLVLVNGAYGHRMAKLHAPWASPRRPLSSPSGVRSIPKKLARPWRAIRRSRTSERFIARLPRVSSIQCSK